MFPPSRPASPGGGAATNRTRDRGRARLHGSGKWRLRRGGLPPAPDPRSLPRDTLPGLFLRLPRAARRGGARVRRSRTAGCGAQDHPGPPLHGRSRRVRDGIAILLLNTPDADAARVAERIRAHLENVSFQCDPAGAARRVTVSMGLVSFPRDGHNETMLLSRARNRLKEAAERSSNQIVSRDGT
ncbi:MAG: diguanylate cyclase [Candidatus Rokubacteria bacterium]|nr:diguanylate cyclase [Candidatus Rokubacteria bacterium]